MAWLLLGACGVIAPWAAAAEFRQGEVVVVGADEVIEEDLYISGQTVTVLGTLKGDLLAFAGNLDIKGVVQGDVMAFAATSRISGDVKGSVRLIGSEVSVVGQVGQDAMLVASDLRLAPSAPLSGDALMVASRATLDGPVRGDLFAAAGELAIQAPVAGDANVQAGSLRFSDEGRIGGDLVYQAERRAEIPEGAVQGMVEHREPPGRTWVGYVVGSLRLLVGLFALGLLLVLVSPTLARRAPSTLRQSPWKSLGIGTAFLIGAPLVAALVFAIGVLIGGWWIGLLALAVYAMALLLAFPVVGIYVGGWLLERFGKGGPRVVLALLLGLALLLLVGRIPFVGALVVLATLLFGTGALLLAAARVRRPMAAAA